VQQRIVGYEPAVDPTDLLAHPLNARRHPAGQRDALRESLSRVGWVDAVKVNTRTGHVVDGHARVEEAITAGEQVPVLYLDLDPDDERFVLATLDPIGALAVYDAEVLDQLLDGIIVESAELAQFLADHAILPDQFEPWNEGDGNSGTGGGDGDEDATLWPTITVALPPRVFTAWNARTADREAHEVLAELLDT